MGHLLPSYQHPLCQIWQGQKILSRHRMVYRPTDRPTNRPIGAKQCAPFLKKNIFFKNVYDVIQRHMRKETFNTFSGSTSLKMIHVHVYFYLSFTDEPRRQRSGLELWPRKLKVGCSNPSRDIPKSLKQVATAPLPCIRQALGVSFTGPRRLPLPLKMQHTINDDQFFVCTETALNMQRMAIIENLINLKKIYLLKAFLSLNFP